MGYSGYGRGGRWGWRRPELDVPPPPPGATRIVVPVTRDAGPHSEVAPVAARAPFLAVIDVGEKLSVRVVPNPAAQAPGGAGRVFAEAVVGMGASLAAVPRLGPNAARALREAGVELRAARPGETLLELLRRLGYA